MAGAYPWPVTFSAALTVLRTTLRQIPPAVIRSPSVQRAVQLVANNFTKWPSVTLPAGVVLKPDALGERRVPGEWLLPNGREDIPERSERLLLWAHGGAFALLSPGSHRRFLAQIALRADTPVFAVDYRKPPDFAFPAPGEDVLHAYGALRGGRRAEQVFLGGDTPGGTWPSQPRGGSRAWAAAPQMGWSCCRPGWTCLGGVQLGLLAQEPRHRFHLPASGGEPCADLLSERRPDGRASLSWPRDEVAKLVPSDALGLRRLRELPLTD
ncbi:unnamed protein product [Prorocentrum cordatum]|uniref:Alpha/beta hydrolase fold-3 domain-containing protein n=1 Tax=Prorocentrum cordatum TaxID=2364126 RepID=A0ABN9T1F2_9DINO|nr:unnamed protein product [Polarella glacialis]